MTPDRSFANRFPRTMTKGMFRGRHFNDINEYQRAVREAQQAPGKARRVVQGPDHTFTLVLVDGTVRMEVTGDPRNPSDVDKALDALAQFGTQVT